MVYRFSKEGRLKGEKTVQDLFRKGTRWHGEHLCLYYQMREGMPGVGQVLFGVSKKIVRKATRRNKIKRRLREAYRQHIHLLDPMKDRNVGFLLGYLYKCSHQDRLTSYKALEGEVIASIHYLLCQVKGYCPEA